MKIAEVGAVCGDAGDGPGGLLGEEGVPFQKTHHMRYVLVLDVVKRQCLWLTCVGILYAFG